MTSALDSLHCRLSVYGTGVDAARITGRLQRIADGALPRALSARLGAAFDQDDRFVQLRKVRARTTVLAGRRWSDDQIAERLAACIVDAVAKAIARGDPKATVVYDSEAACRADFIVQTLVDHRTGPSGAWWFDAVAPAAAGQTRAAVIWRALTDAREQVPDILARLQQHGRLDALLTALGADRTGKLWESAIPGFDPARALRFESPRHTNNDDGEAPSDDAPGAPVAARSDDSDLHALFTIALGLVADLRAALSGGVPPHWTADVTGDERASLFSRYRARWTWPLDWSDTAMLSDAVLSSVDLIVADRPLPPTPRRRTDLAALLDAAVGDHDWLDQSRLRDGLSALLGEPASPAPTADNGPMTPPETTGQSPTQNRTAHADPEASAEHRVATQAAPHRKILQADPRQSDKSVVPKPAIQRQRASHHGSDQFAEHRATTHAAARRRALHADSEPSGDDPFDTRTGPRSHAVHTGSDATVEDPLEARTTLHRAVSQADPEQSLESRCVKPAMPRHRASHRGSEQLADDCVAPPAAPRHSVLQARPNRPVDDPLATPAASDQRVLPADTDPSVNGRLETPTASYQTALQADSHRLTEAPFANRATPRQRALLDGITAMLQAGAVTLVPGAPARAGNAIRLYAALVQAMPSRRDDPNLKPLIEVALTLWHSVTDATGRAPPQESLPAIARFGDSARKLAEVLAAARPATTDCIVPGIRAGDWIDTPAAGVFRLLRGVNDLRLAGLADQAALSSGSTAKRPADVLLALLLRLAGQGENRPEEIDPALRLAAGPAARDDLTGLIDAWQDTDAAALHEGSRLLLERLAGQRLVHGQHLHIWPLRLDDGCEALLGGAATADLIPFTTATDGDETRTAATLDGWIDEWRQVLGAPPTRVVIDPALVDRGPTVLTARQCDWLGSRRGAAARDRYTTQRRARERTDEALQALAQGQLGLPPIDLWIAVTAMATLRLWARWLPGFADASVGFLLDSFVRRPGRVRVCGDDAIEVAVTPGPLDLVLTHAGYDRPIPSLPWLGGRSVRFLKET